MTDPTLARFFPLPDYRAPIQPPERTTRDIPLDLLSHMAVKLHMIELLAWDYADTVISWLGGAMNSAETKRLSRRIRQLKTDYDIFHSHSLDDESTRRAFDLALLFESVCKKHITKLCYGLRNELRKAFPDLSEKSYTLLLAVYQLLTITDTMKMFAAECDVTIRSYGVNKHSILCDEAAQLAKLAPEFAGDCYMKSESRRLTAKILLNELKQIELFETKEPT